MNYELFILGTLVDGPMHGYLLREIINIAIAPTRQMSWGALYPLLRRLESDGLIEQVPDASASGDRPRKVYRLTTTGKERFTFLMLRPGEPGPEYGTNFDTKMSNFQHLTPKQRLAIIAEYEQYVRFIRSQLAKAREFAASEPHIEEAERQWILRVQDHRLCQIDADLAWIHSLQDEIAVDETT